MYVGGAITTASLRNVPEGTHPQLQYSVLEGLGETRDTFSIMLLYKTERKVQKEKIR